MEKDKIIEEFQKNKKQIKSIGINTDPDDRDEQIKVLREGIIRHIRINKQLTHKLMNEQ